VVGTSTTAPTTVKKIAIMYRHNNKEYTQTGLVAHLFQFCLNNYRHNAVNLSRDFDDIFDDKGNRYEFSFKFNRDNELKCFTCKKIEAKYHTDPFKFYLDNDKRSEFCNTRTEVAQFCKAHADEFFSMQIGADGTRHGIRYTADTDSIVFDRKAYPYKKFINA
jgi:hypothetical protein